MKRGFTLIELLAVIVMLAIIALIATPIILGIINDAREDSNKRSVENYAHAVELAVARDATKKGGVIETGPYTIDFESKGRKIISQSGNIIEVDYKGEAVTDGKINVLSDGKIEINGISFNKGKTSYNYSEEFGVTKVENGEGGNNEATSPFKVTDDGLLLYYERQGDETSVVVPAEVNGIKIKKIGLSAFTNGNIVLTESAGIPGLIILDEANEDAIREFAKENNVTNIAKISEFGVENDPFEIENSSLGYIDSLGEIKYSDDMLSMHYMKSVDLSQMKYLETISDRAFVGYYGYGNEECGSYGGCILGTLESVILPENGVLKTIGYAAFEYNKLTEITVPSSVEIIDDYAFAYNQNLTKINFEEGLISIGQYTFDSNACNEIVIPSTVTTLKHCALGSIDKKIIIKRENGDGMYIEDNLTNVIFDPNYQSQ